jgi:hypothetical protein
MAEEELKEEMGLMEDTPHKVLVDFFQVVAA